MTTNKPLNRALSTLLSELVDGAAAAECFVLNPGDPGLLRSLARLSAAQASALPADGGASIAAHVEHVRYGIDLLNQWAAGDESVFSTADYSQSWERGTVSDSEWTRLREHLADELHRWRQTLESLATEEVLHLTGAISSVVHLAYHLGAIRQIDRSLRGPQAKRAGS